MGYMYIDDIYIYIISILFMYTIYVYIYWLVVSSPLTNMSSSAGMMTFPKPPTRQIPVLFWACILARICSYAIIHH